MRTKIGYIVILISLVLILNACTKSTVAPEIQSNTTEVKNEVVIDNNSDEEKNTNLESDVSTNLGTQTISETGVYINSYKNPFDPTKNILIYADYSGEISDKKPEEIKSCGFRYADSLGCYVYLGTETNKQFLGKLIYYDVYSEKHEYYKENSLGNKTTFLDAHTLSFERNAGTFVVQTSINTLNKEVIQNTWSFTDVEGLGDIPESVLTEVKDNRESFKNKAESKVKGYTYESKKATFEACTRDDTIIFDDCNFN